MSQGKRREWEWADHERLIKLWSIVQSVALIAIIMDRTPSSVQTQASRLDLPPREEHRGRHRRRWFAEDDERLQSLAEEYRTTDGKILILKLADEMSRSIDAVISRLVVLSGNQDDVYSSLYIEDVTAGIPGEGDDEEDDVYSSRGNSGLGQIKEAGKRKKCLKCGNPFWSKGNHNWVCRKCKRSDEWGCTY